MRGDILQMGRNPSKDGNKAASIYMRSETGLDYIVSAKCAKHPRITSEGFAVIIY